MNEQILVFCAHNDDQIIGVGGTISKYAKEGKDVFVYIFSYGEKSHPHFRREVIIKQRVKEAKKSNKHLGVRQTYFFGLPEGRFAEDATIKEKIRKIIKSRKPKKVFTHSIDDPHPDHRAVHSIVSDSLQAFKGEAYTFEVWNILSLRKRNSPKLVVDVSKTFETKVKAFKMHESQQIAVWTLLWNIYLKAFVNGFNNGVKYAEVFNKIQ